MTNLNAVNPLKHAAGLSAIWQKCLSEVYGSECRILIDPEHGKLKRLKESLGMKRATEVVEYAIRNWGNFARKSAKDVGSDIFPEKPSVGWLCKYHAIALLMLQEELQSIAKKQAEEEQAKKEAQLKEAAEGANELKVKQPSVTLLQLTPEQFSAYWDWLENENSANEASWFDKLQEKYGEWRPAKPGEKGIPCDIGLNKAA